MFIVDAHLDLAYNVSRGRDVLKPSSEQPTIGNEIASVSLPELRAGGVGLICATIFCEPAGSDCPTGYRDSDGAHTQAQSQLRWYHEQFAAGEMALVRTRDELSGAGAADSIKTILLLEGGDAIRSPDDVKIFFDAGVRIVGLAWKRTRYAGGTSEPGPLSDEGKRLVPILDRIGMIHDISHLAEHAFWQLLDLATGPILASHSNCRAIVGGPNNRHLTDDMIKAIGARGGVIGINFCDRFLLPHHDYGTRRATLADFVNHVKHMCDLTGSAEHVAIGTDMDGGLGREQIPAEIETSADMQRVGDALSAARLNDGEVAQILGDNWIRFFSQALPQAAG